MTPALPRIDSESTVGGGVYEDNEAVTNLPLLAGQIGQDLVYQRPRWPWIVDDTRTTIESTELQLQPVSDYLEVLTRDEPGLVRGAIRKLLLPEYQAPATASAGGSKGLLCLCVEGTDITGRQHS